MFARHTITKLVGAAIAVAALGLATPGTASAYTPQDLTFLQKVLADAVNFGEANRVIQRAHTICDAFAGGDSPLKVHEALMTNSAFTPRQAAIFMADAVQVYCPQFGGQFMS